MLPTLVRRMATKLPKPEVQYPLKKSWPPDFTQMPYQEQLRFEKRYKRRLRHVSQRPRWDKFVQITQFFTISFVIVYSALWLEWEDGSFQPMTPFRKWVYSSFGYEYVPRPVRELKPNPDRVERR